ncbi:hypothetical protein [Capnocytophaga sp. oral taxon 878]|uniref:hypothetical protein n=1 Tax=Capnocytophaga sp. oral taxon 878 TaxID=1316596 RepID=UPI000D032860|nr:hypothetical protein [Capnocytophaga sp. oral taxon 878]AVM51546.1 hypothetical protein C4H12_13590 [Capnocytophaga sp. oral taxon 878]
MKKNILLATAFTLLFFSEAMAVDLGIKKFFSEIYNEIKGAYPYAAATGLVLAAIWNKGNFIGQNADTSKGFKNLGIYVAFVAIIAGFAKAVEAYAKNF